MRAAYHRMQAKGHTTGLSDIEGELIYLLIRDTKPNLVFEVSPASGWSTNYILAALTKNQHGVCHSFEIEPNEKIIRGNLTSLCDPSCLTLHIGDARKLVDSVPGEIEFLFLDSLHEDYFAEWYIKALMPRVRGSVIIHDVAFRDQLEPSSEASFLWRWVSEHRIDAEMIAAIDTPRVGLIERTVQRPNALLLQIPPVNEPALSLHAPSPGDLIDQAERAISIGDNIQANSRLTEAISMLLRDPIRESRHRLLLRGGQVFAAMDEYAEARRTYQRALGVVLQQEHRQRTEKGLPETFRFFLRNHEWGFAIKTLGCMILEPRSLRRFK